MASLIRPGSPTANSIIRRQESVAGGTPMQAKKWWIQRVRFSDMRTAGTSLALDLNAYFTGNDFPPGVFLEAGGHYLDLVQVFAGGAVTAATLSLGDAAVPTALVTAQNVWTGATLGPIQAAGAQYATGLYESQFLPLLTLTTTTANTNVLTTGIVDVYIAYNIRPSRRGA